MKRWIWASASRVGTSHVRNGQTLQDAHVCQTLRIGSLSDYMNHARVVGIPFSDELEPICDTGCAHVQGDSGAGLFLAIVSDGAGSAAHGRQGAVLACRFMQQAVRRYCRQIDAELLVSKLKAIPSDDVFIRILPDINLLRGWVDEVRQRIDTVARTRGIPVRDFACTLVCALSDGNQTMIAHIGDGGVVARDADKQCWLSLSWPDHGEYASTTSFLTDDPLPDPRVVRVDRAIDVLVLFSDGLERLALEMESKVPFKPFFSGNVRTAK